MKNKLLQIVTLVFFSVGSVHYMFNALSSGDKSNLLPFKISPQSPGEHYVPQQKNNYSPQKLNRLYLFEHIHRSVERGKKGITS